jgi:hypothetical protein
MSLGLDADGEMNFFVWFFVCIDSLSLALALALTIDCILGPPGISMYNQYGWKFNIPGSIIRDGGSQRQI